MHVKKFLKVEKLLIIMMVLMMGMMIKIRKMSIKGKINNMYHVNNQVNKVIKFLEIQKERN